MKGIDFLFGFLYALLYFAVIPALTWLIVALIVWAPSGHWVAFWWPYCIGLLFSIGTAWLLSDKMYFVNNAFTCSFWLDPFFGDKDAPEDERLICVGPGFHFRMPWWQFDMFTEHEREVTVPLSGKFETFGEDNLNLEITGGVLILKLPMSSARKLRALNKGSMDEIRKEIEKQLTPALKQATAQVFAMRSPREGIMLDQAGTAHQIRLLFEKSVQLLKRYGLETMKFSLGDVNFSNEIETVREQAFATKKRIDASNKLMQPVKEGGLGFTNGERAMEFVVSGEEPGSMKINRQHFIVSGVSNEAAEGFGKGIAAGAALFGGKTEEDKNQPKKRRTRGGSNPS